MKGPIEYIVEAWKIYTKKENFIFFAKVMAVLVLVTTAIGFVTGYFYPEDYLKNADFSNISVLVGFIALSLVAIIAGLWSQTVTYISIFKMGSNEIVLFKLGYKNIWKYLSISLVVGLIFFGGAILLIIPAFIFGVWYSFSTFLVLDKKLGIKESLKRSKAMVSGNFWRIVGRYFVFGLFGFAISIALTTIPYVGSLLVSFIAPLFTLPFYLLYRDLSIN